MFRLIDWDVHLDCYMKTIKNEKQMQFRYMHLCQLMLLTMLHRLYFWAGMAKHFQTILHNTYDGLQMHYSERFIDNSGIRLFHCIRYTSFRESQNNFHTCRNFYEKFKLTLPLGYGSKSCSQGPHQRSDCPTSQCPGHPLQTKSVK